MKKRQFIDALKRAGWKPDGDAQHDNIEAFWSQLFPVHARLEKFEMLVDNIAELADCGGDAECYCSDIEELISEYPGI